MPTISDCHARNPYLAVFFVRADVADDGIGDPLPRRFADLLKHRNGERDMLADHRRCPDARSSLYHRAQLIHDDRVQLSQPAASPAHAAR
jgi:hypothetical protein